MRFTLCLILAAFFLPPALHAQAAPVLDRAALEARAKANPADLEAQVLLAKSYLDTNEAAKALPHLKAAATLRPDAGPLVFQYGVVQLDTGDLEGGYQTLTALSLREPNEAATRAYLVRATCRLNKPEETREHLAALRRLVPADPLFHAQLVEWTATEGDPRVALEEIEFTLRLPLDNKRKARVRYLDGFSRNRLGDRDGAIASLNESIALDAGEPRPYALILTIQGAERMRNMDAAMLKEAIRRFPTSTDLLLLVGLLNIENEEYQSVKEIAARLDVVVPGSPEAMLLRGHVFLALNDPESASQMFQQAMARGMVTPHILHHLGLAEQKSGRTREALGAYARALDLDGSDVELLFDNAQLLLNLGKAEEAKVLALRMVSLSPATLRAHKLLADVERKLGNSEAAATHLAEFKRLSIAAQATRRQESGNAREEPTVPAP